MFWDNLLCSHRQLEASPTESHAYVHQEIRTRMFTVSLFAKAKKLETTEISINKNSSFNKCDMFSQGDALQQQEPVNGGSLPVSAQGVSKPQAQSKL
jgi:hypothetical protein